MAKSKFVDALSRFFTATATNDKAQITAAAKALDEAMPEEESVQTEGARDAKMVKDAIDEALKPVRDWMKSKDEAEKKDKEDRERKEAQDKAARDALLTAEGLGETLELGKVWTGDSVAPTLKTIVQRAEILCPGVRAPTSDAVSALAVKGFMLEAIRGALKDANSAEQVNGLLMGRTLDSLGGREVLGVFNGAAELMRQANQFRIRPAGISLRAESEPVDINKINADFWAKRAGNAA